MHNQFIFFWVDNQFLSDFGHYDITVQNEKVFKPITGNVRDEEIKLQIEPELVQCRDKASIQDLQIFKSLEQLSNT